MKYCHARIRENVAFTKIANRYITTCYCVPCNPTFKIVFFISHIRFRKRLYFASIIFPIYNICIEAIPASITAAIIVNGNHFTPLKPFNAILEYWVHTIFYESSIVRSSHSLFWRCFFRQKETNLLKSSSMFLQNPIRHRQTGDFWIKLDCWAMCAMLTVSFNWSFDRSFSKLDRNIQAC